MSLYDDNLKKKKEFNTLDNTYEMFPIGTHVMVVTLCCDFNFFYNETGMIIRNEGILNILDRLEGVEKKQVYLGITVKFDKPRHFKDGSVQETFNFNPVDLVVVDKKVTDFVNNLEDISTVRFCKMS